MGGPDGGERLVSRLDGFDCVTFVETVWALSAAEGLDDLENGLRALRYRDGRVDWADRNHYTNQWIDRNARAGRLTRVLAERWEAVGAPRRLSALAGYPEVPWEPVCLPRDRVGELDGVARHGDLVAFVSARDDLDVFHVGLLVAAEPLRLRHAGRTAGRVVDEPLGDFLDRNETPGLLVARAAGVAPAGGGR